MIGRDHELRRLMRLVSSSRPQVAILAGEPGIGKTRLIHELVAAARRAGVGARRHAQPGSLGRPYELLLDAIARPAARTRHSSTSCADTIAQPGRAPAGWRSLVAGCRRRPRRSSSSRTCTGPTRRAPRCSSASPTWTAPRLLIGTYRPAEVTRRSRSPGCSAGWSDATRSPTSGWSGSPRTRPRRCCRSATGRPAPYRAAMALHQRTGGNPFFLEELLRAQDGRSGEALRAAAAVEPGRGAAPAGRGPRAGSAAAGRGGRGARPPHPVRPAGRRHRAWRGRAHLGAARVRRPGRAGGVRRGRVRASGTRWSARRSPPRCSAGSAAACTRPRSTHCSRADSRGTKNWRQQKRRPGGPHNGARAGPARSRA